MMGPAPENPEKVLQDLSNDLMSPFCPGRTISACPSDQARKLEDHILAEAKSGKSRGEIEQGLVERYGSDIVGYAPPPVVLWTSAVLGLVALVVLAWLGRRWVGRTGATSGAPGEAAASASGRKPSQAELDALDDALDEVDEF